LTLPRTALGRQWEDEGKAVLLISADLDEIMMLSDKDRGDV